MKIAVVGAGVSGLVTAYLLAPEHEVHLFEARPRLGGHTLTVDVEEPVEVEKTLGGEAATRSLAIDMGFIVYNHRTYPLFTRFLEELGVATEESAMSFSVRDEESGLEYCGSPSLLTLFAQKRNLLRPSFHRMLTGVLRLHRLAPRMLAAAPEVTLGDFLTSHRLRGPVVDHYLVPMASSIWSTDPGGILQFPVRAMAAFLVNHGMLQVFDRPRWRVVSGGSQRYLDALEGRLGEVRLRSPVERVARRGGGGEGDAGVEVKVRDAAAETFDRVVLALHSDRALALLADPTAAERQVLEAIPYQENEVVLHTDVSVLPRRRRAWAAWNYHICAGDSGPGREQVKMTYWMNRLQNLRAGRQYCVTLNRTAELDPDLILEKRRMSHPLYTRAALGAQGRWREVSAGRILYCGAYWGHGFHEDGVRSAARVAAALGVSW